EPEPTPSTSPRPEAEPACSARAEVVDKHVVGFTATVTITNDSAARLVDWTSTFTMPGGYRMTDAKNVEIVQGGKHGTVRGTGATAVIDGGSSVTFDITATGFGRSGEP